MIEKRPVVGWIGHHCSGGLTLRPDPDTPRPWMLSEGPTPEVELGHGIPTHLVDGLRAELEDVLDRIVAAQARYGSAPESGHQGVTGDARS